MAKIIDFPDMQEREWIEWQRLIREKFSAEGVEEAVTTHALPRIKDHWVPVFEPLNLELPKRAVPGRA